MDGLLMLVGMAVAWSGPSSAVAVPPAHQRVVPGVPAAGGFSPAGARLLFQLPAGWVSQPPESGMRLAQAAIPGPGGPGQFAIFYFGAGGGGTPAANIARWIGQIDKPAAPPRPEAFTAHGLSRSWVQEAGTLKASTA